MVIIYNKNIFNIKWKNKFFNLKKVGDRKKNYKNYKKIILGWIIKQNLKKKNKKNNFYCRWGGCFIELKILNTSFRIVIWLFWSVYYYFIKYLQNQI
jgi:hypothetical protein